MFGSFIVLLHPRPSASPRAPNAALQGGAGNGGRPRAPAARVPRGPARSSRRTQATLARTGDSPRSCNASIKRWDPGPPRWPARFGSGSRLDAYAACSAAGPAPCVRRGGDARQEGPQEAGLPRSLRRSWEGWAAADPQGGQPGSLASFCPRGDAAPGK